MKRSYKYNQTKKKQSLSGAEELVNHMDSHDKFLEKTVDEIITKVPEFVRMARNTDLRTRMNVTNDLDFLQGYVMGMIQGGYLVAYRAAFNKAASETVQKESGIYLQQRATEIRKAIMRVGE